MNFSDKTLAVLKNFASINSGVVLRKGNVQKTISPEKSILVEATLEDTLDSDFGIYDLNQFLGNVTTLKNPDLTFTSEHVTLDDGDFSLTYFGSSPSLIISPPDKELALKTVDCKFDLSNATLQKLLKIATMNSLPNLTVMGKNGELRLKIHEKANDTSNYGDMKIGDYVGDDFINKDLSSYFSGWIYKNWQFKLQSCNVYGIICSNRNGTGTPVYVFQQFNIS